MEIQNDNTGAQKKCTEKYKMTKMIYKDSTRLQRHTKQPQGYKTTKKSVGDYRDTK